MSGKQYHEAEDAQALAAAIAWMKKFRAATGRDAVRLAMDGPIHLENVIRMAQSLVRQAGTGDLQKRLPIIPPRLEAEVREVTRRYLREISTLGQPASLPDAAPLIEKEIWEDT